MKKPRGFIALTSVLILSIVLITIAVGAGAANFYARMNALEREFKTQSRAVAESCLAYVRLKRLASAAYEGGESLSTFGGTCEISPVTSSGGTDTFFISGSYKNAVSILSATLTSDSSITEEKEIPTIPS